MIKIYNIRPDFEKAFVAPAEGMTGGKGTFCLLPMAPAWKPRLFYVKDPVRTTLGDFVGIGSGALAWRKNVDEGPLGEVLGRAGEILPASL